MFDCADDVLAHHDEKVTLPQDERTAMHDRRNANRDRLKRGLKEANKPAPREFISQGSYAMKTMVQHPEYDYDIDDGVYFRKESLVGERGAEMSPCKSGRWSVTRSMTAPSTRSRRCARIAFASTTRLVFTSTCRSIVA